MFSCQPLDGGFIAKRADSELHQRNILRDVVNGIVECDLLIADLSGLNPNVMYELGMAHGLQKATVLLTQNLGEVPFDLRAYRIQPYTPAYRDVNKLKDTLTTVLKEFRNGQVAFGNPITDFAIELTVSDRLGSAEPSDTIHSGDTSSDTEPMGVLDFQESVEGAASTITSWANDIAHRMGDFATDLDHRTGQLKAIVDNDSNAFKKRRAIVSSATQLINSWALGLEESLPEVNEAWQQMDATTDGFLVHLSISNDTERAEARHLIGQMETLLQQITEAQQAVQGTIKSTLSTRNISREMTNASRRAERALKEVRDSIETGKSYASRVISVLNDRIDEYESTEEES